MLQQVLFGGLAVGSIYGLVALGFAVVFKATDVFNFAQGMFVVFYASIAALVVARVLPVASLLVVASLPVMRRTWAAFSEPKPAESPVPMPSTARPPESSSTVAMAEAVTMGWRVMGLVTRGPNITRCVFSATMVACE